MFLFYKSLNLRQVKQIRATNTFDETCQRTVPQAIVAFLESNSFENAVKLAISIGGDSDTIGAMTGAIAEAYYGVPVDIVNTAFSMLPDDFKIILEKMYDKTSMI